jgi:hypothetical protein
MAQIFAAAAASLIGPATSRSCMPSPFWFSLITMIGRNPVSGPLDLHFRSPRQRARKPGIEFAPPTSTPNSVRCTASVGAVVAGSCSFTSSFDDGDVTTSAIGAAAMTFAGPGSTNLGAAGSGGASTDLETREVAPGTTEATLADGAAGEVGATRGSGPEARIGGFSAVAGALAATCGTADADGSFWAAAGASVDDATAGAGIAGEVGEVAAAALAETGAVDAAAMEA